MLSDPEKLRQFVTQITTALAAIGALVAMISGGAEWLQKHLLKSLPLEIATTVAWVVLGALAFLFVGLAWRASVKRPKLRRPDAFDLKVTRRDQLKGRDEDIADLLGLLKEFPLVFLVGESGSGKSALVAFGLAPEINVEGRMVPVLLRSYGTDWETGPLKETVLALWEALSDDERATIDMVTRPDPSAVVPEYLTKKLRQIAQRTGRTPLLIFDQFDDYQLRHRKKFLTEKRAWKSAQEIEASNAFWGLIGEALRADTVRCLIVTRSDTASGLSCAKFVGESACRTRTLDRIQAVFVGSLLDDLAPSSAAPPIIEFPEAGWIQLKEVLSRDLQRHGMALPQQIHTVVLGLRSDPPLMTVRDYWRAGGAAGVEARFVHLSISGCAAKHVVQPGRVRMALLAMVDPASSEGEAKTRARSEHNLDEIVGDSKLREQILQDLCKDEVVRPIPNAETGGTDWQLDHDYLASAVLHEERIRIVMLFGCARLQRRGARPKGTGEGDTGTRCCLLGHS